MSIEQLPSGGSANPESSLAVMGKLKNRVVYLRARIETDKRELQELEVRLENLENEEYLAGWQKAYRE